MTPVPQLVKNRMTPCLRTASVAACSVRPAARLAESRRPGTPGGAQGGLRGSCVLRPGVGATCEPQQGTAWQFGVFAMCQGRRSSSGPAVAVRPGGGCQAPDSPAPSGGPRFSPLRGGGLWPGRLCSAFSWAGQRRESSASPFGPWHGQLQPAPGLRRGVLLLLPDCGHWGCFVLGPGSPRRCSR